MIATEKRGEAWFGAERRRWTRESVQSAAMLKATIAGGSISLPGEPAIVAQAFDISVGGVGFRACEALEIGEVYRLCLTEKRKHPARAEVRNCRPRTDGSFDIGAAFC